MAYPVFGSASSETSGTFRIVVEPFDAEEPAPLCQLGIAQKVLIPPPPAAQLLSFQVVSDFQLPEFKLSLVPPTPSTVSCEAGSSTARSVVSFGMSYAPVSPEAATAVWPCVAIFANGVAS